MTKTHSGSLRHLPRGLLIQYEDRDILVVDKPAGLLSIASGTEREKTAYWIIAEYLRKKGEKRRPGVVHRLDRDTSGLMLFAKSEPVKKLFMENWEQMVIERRYVALAEGIPGGENGADEGVINQPLGEDRSGRVVVQAGGKPAVTRWKALEHQAGHTLLALELETGRRNQIRAHLAWLGHPVAGDVKYHARTNPLKRLALHAETLAFYHPYTKELLRFMSPAKFHVRSRFSCESVL
jgi:23S rRNA pseudouridine1911/1915/1917 synthase